MIKIFNSYKYYIIVLFLLFLIGFITGIITSAQYSSVITCDNLINKYLLNFLKREMTYFSLFLMLSVFFVLISLFVIFFTRNTFFVVVDVVILMLIAYIFGFDVCIIFMCLGFAGVVLGILFWGVIGILDFIILILIISVAVKRLKQKNRVLCPQDNLLYVKVYITLIICGILLIFLMCFLFSLIHIFVIVD